MKTRGFTLVELMISLALFGLIASGAMGMVLSASRSQQRSARVDVTQSGLRAGTDFVSRDLLSISAGARSAALTIGSTGVVVQPVTVTDSATGPDTLDVYLIDATISANVVAAVSATSTSITVDSTAGFAVGDTIQLCDLASGVLVTITGFGTSGGYPTINIGNPNTFPATVTVFSPGSYVFKARHVTYAVSNFFGSSATDGNGLALTMNLNNGAGAQPLAEGIEDLQVALGFDNNADGIITEVGSAAGDDEWVFNVAGETAPASLTNLKAVRVTLVAKSTQADPGPQSAPPPAENHPAGTADNFLRRTLRTEIGVRNFNL